MASFPPVTMTTEGLNMIAKASSGNSQDRLIITKVKLGDGVSEGNIRDYTDVISSKKEVTLAEWEDRGDGRFRYTFIYNNEGVKTGFYHREIGLFAKNGDSGTEKLIAYSNAGSYPGYIDDETKEIPYQRLMINIGVGDTDNVSGQVDVSNAVTIEMLNEHDADENVHANLIKRLFSSATATMEGVKQKIEDWAKKVCLPLSGGILTGDLDASGHSITANKFKGTATYSEYTNRAYTGQLSYNADTPYYTTFAKIPKTDTTANCTLLFSNGANTAQDKMATYIMYLGTNKGQSPKMLVEQLTSFKSAGEPEFGYYVDGEYFCFGVKSPWYRGISAFTVLARPGTLEIGTIKNQTDMPNGWTSVSPTTLQTATANTLMQQKIATMSLNIIENNDYWTKNIDGLITQIAEVNPNEEQEIDVQFPISFPQKCLFVDTKIINEEKDTNINCDFHIIDKTVDGVKLLKVGTGSPKKILVKVIGI